MGLPEKVLSFHVLAAQTSSLSSALYHGDGNCRFSLPPFLGGANELRNAWLAAACVLLHREPLWTLPFKNARCALPNKVFGFLLTSFLCAAQCTCNNVLPQDGKDIYIYINTQPHMQITPAFFMLDWCIWWDKRTSFCPCYWYYRISTKDQDILLGKSQITLSNYSRSPIFNLQLQNRIACISHPTAKTGQIWPLGWFF